MRADQGIYLTSLVQNIFIFICFLTMHNAQGTRVVGVGVHKDCSRGAFSAQIVVSVQRLQVLLLVDQMRQQRLVWAKLVKFHS